MGATNCPETPRQRMIGMMYLVLTAMLALNVSKNILDAFSIIDEATVVSIENTERSLNTDYNFLVRQKALKGEEKIGVPLQKVTQLQQLSDEMVKYVEKIKTDLLDVVDGGALNKEGKPKSIKDIGGKEEISKTTNFIFNSGLAKQLKDKITTYKSAILAFVDKPEQRTKLSESVGLIVDGDYYNNDDKKETWEAHNFNGTILAATVTMLNKTINEVRSAQSVISKSIIDDIEGDNFKFDKVKGQSIPDSRMVFRGSGYNADIIVAAYDSKIPAKAFYKMGVDTLTSEEGATPIESVDGIVKLNIPAGSIGEQRYAGFIRIIGPDGTPVDYPFKDKYTVVEPLAVIAADNMNVLYAGIENPVTTSSPGIASDKISLNVEGCAVSKAGPGKFNVRPSESSIGKTVTATSSANGDRSTQSLGTQTFRVKRVPDPQAKLGSISAGRKTKQEILANPFVVAKMDESFVYDLKWQINSFQVSIIERGMEDGPYSAQGNQLPANVVAKIRNAAPRTVIQITGIRASSTVLPARPLNDIMISIR
ncbi:MAG: gliding motility protein GldM [Bacteroidales bacterium]|jgi:gliding motility-associated protein GldM|nr:gliding motility protein GldM [Bacteroidales bacterium]